MVLIFIDESGSIDYTDGTNIYLLNAILLKEEDFLNFYLNIFKEKERIASKYNLKSSNFELHASNLFSQEKGMTSLGKKLDFNYAIELYRSIMINVYSNTQFKVISVAILKDKVTQQDNIKYWNYTMLLERIEMTLRDEYQTMGIIIRDTEDLKKDMRIKELVKDIILQSTKIKFKRVLPAIYFIDSRLSEGVQLSDFTAYNVKRYLEKKIYNEHGEELNTIEIFNEYVSKKFSGHPSFIGKGLKIFPNISIEE
ncbi:MAG: hypothetical protein CEE43_13765 [Promethearchaeota archaeon Loki_b32]|nr:MAG: hypothetical protein CEE43_13765 [Candidatus Lokiarchaeota archaeon Loki_b32]